MRTPCFIFIILIRHGANKTSSHAEICKLELKDGIPYISLSQFLRKSPSQEEGQSQERPSKRNKLPSFPTSNNLSGRLASGVSEISLVPQFVILRWKKES